MTIAPIDPVAAAAVSAITAMAPTASSHVAEKASGSFAQTLLNGLDATNDRLVNADNLVRAFVTQGPDGGIPLHQIAYAMETARMDFELDMQIRTKMLDAYQQLMAMQI